MAKGKGINLNLPSVDELFSTQEERDEAKRESVRNIPIAEITDFPNHPFKVKTDENMLDMGPTKRTLRTIKMQVNL